MQMEALGKMIITEEGNDIGSNPVLRPDFFFFPQSIFAEHIWAYFTWKYTYWYLNLFWKTKRKEKEQGLRQLHLTFQKNKKTKEKMAIEMS